jgi:hypothetical protein
MTSETPLPKRLPVAAEAQVPRPVKSIRWSSQAYLWLFRSARCSQTRQQKA